MAIRSTGSVLSEVQVWSVRARMPRSTRPPPPAQASIRRRGWASRSRSMTRWTARTWSIQSRSGSALPGRPASVKARLASHLSQSTSFSPTSRSRVSSAHASTSGREKSSTSWLRSSVAVRVGEWRTQSGWARYSSLSRLTISGSTHRPKAMPRRCTCSANGRRPSGKAAGRGVQSPRPARSSRRAPNQPSSRTKSSAPSAAARSARRSCPAWETSKWVASQEL